MLTSRRKALWNAVTASSGPIMFRPFWYCYAARRLWLPVCCGCC